MSEVALSVILPVLNGVDAAAEAYAADIRRAEGRVVAVAENHSFPAEKALRMLAAPLVAVVRGARILRRVLRSNEPAARAAT